MFENLSQLSEDDIRTKVVYEWLKDSGLSINDILIEYSISIRLGKGIKNINSRTDILVKNTQGLNLLIIEVKRPKHSLNEKDKLQGISYARALVDGIAPFTILTNGQDVAIYDSVTGTEITGTKIPCSHPYIKNGFRVSSDALRAKAEALEYLISLSAENFLCFCKAQVEYRMQLLKSKDLFSNKKYIPQLYVKRNKTREELDKKLFDEKESKQFVLVIGQPQYGKTCFMCNTIESYQKKEIPVLFYPAISLKDGLFKEMQEDFDWHFSEQNNPAQLISKLQRITQQTGKDIIIFIDGWNEMLEQALIINDECQRLKNNNIKIVLSTTSPSVNRLLQDEAANLTFIAGETNLNAAAIQTLTTKPLVNTKELSVVQIGEFDEYELKRGRRLHERAYNTKFPDESSILKSPFYLRLASEVYANESVPLFALRTELIQMGLRRKAARRGIQEINLLSILNQVACIILEKDSPFCCMDLPKDLHSEEILTRWIESGIFIRLYEKEIPAIDFYYTYERDYCIAILNRRLHEKLTASNEKVAFEEFNYLIRTESGKSALRWFLSCPEYFAILKNVFILLMSQIEENHLFSKILTDAIFNQVTLNNNHSFNWLERYIEKIISKQNNQDNISIDLPTLIYSFLQSINREKEREKYEFWMRLLVKYDISDTEQSKQESLIYKYYELDEIGRCYFEATSLADKFDLLFFERLITDNDLDIANKAAMLLAYVYPTFILKKIPSIKKYYEINNLNGIDQIIENTCNCILKELSYYYYGDICPGFLSFVEKGDYDVVNEFHSQKALWFPILKILSPETELYSDIVEMLGSLNKYIGENDDSLTNLPFNDPNQLKIEFPE